jgi:hypothetical protein
MRDVENLEDDFERGFEIKVARTDETVATPEVGVAAPTV